MNTLSRFHSVTLYDPACKGCTICVTTCPSEAIRVHGGKAHILEERCIDCGECIRRCPSRAKRAVAPSIDILRDYPCSVALVSPSLYSQFDTRYSFSNIRNALLKLGFTHVADVSRGALLVSHLTAHYLKTTKDLVKPIISSSCPAVVKLVQIRFPTLIPHLLPLMPPVEVTAREIRKKLGPDCATFFISPCPAKITEPRSPVGYPNSEITGAFSAADLYLPLLNALKNSNSDSGTDHNSTVVENGDEYACAWGVSGGETDILRGVLPGNEDIRWINCDGIAQTIEILESIEDGTLDSVDFAEIAACPGGCAGGPLTVKPVPLARAIMRERLAQTLPPLSDSVVHDYSAEFAEYRMGEDIAQRPALLLSRDFSKARKMMEELETIFASLPGLDCGSCGAPNCRALADDIVRKQAKKEDCIHILKKEYEQLVFGAKRV